MYLRTSTTASQQHRVKTYQIYTKRSPLPAIPVSALDEVGDAEHNDDDDHKAAGHRNDDV